MVYLVDGIAGHKAWNAEKRLATHLAGKWNQGYSQMVYYVLCEGQDGNCSGLCKQPLHSWQQGLGIDSNPGAHSSLTGCPWRLADLAGHVNASGTYPHHSLIWAGQLDQFSIFSTAIGLVYGAIAIRAWRCHETNYSYIN
jgi:hypothetical protein